MNSTSGWLLAERTIPPAPDLDEAYFFAQNWVHDQGRLAGTIAANADRPTISETIRIGVAVHEFLKQWPDDTRHIFEYTYDLARKSAMRDVTRTRWAANGHRTPPALGAPTGRCSV